MKIIDQREVLSVAEINGIAKEVLESLSFWVEGEVYDFRSSNQRYYYIYFQLKDEDGKTILPAIMYPQTFDSLGFTFDNGQRVLAHGKLTLFTKTGKYQFLADQLELAGEGLLAKELEKLKAKLQAEGLLDTDRKRPLPQFPQRIGVITSATSDAWADFQRHSVAKFPVMELYLADSYVQGPRAVNSLLRAIDYLQKQDLDVLVLIRGGGSLEDLAAFNDEKVVRAIAASSIPTMVGVGHEKDISIADLVADVRASTPTNAGQILTKPYEEVEVRLEHQALALKRSIKRLMDDGFSMLDYLSAGLQRTSVKYQTLPMQLSQLALRLDHGRHALLDSQSVVVAALHEKLQLSAQHWLTLTQQKLDAHHKQLLAVSPLAILQRGYSVISINESIIRSSHQVKQGDTMQIQLARGSLRGLVTRIEDPHE